MVKYLLASGMAILSLAVLLSVNQAGEKKGTKEVGEKKEDGAKKGKYTIAEVMKIAHKGGLMKKVADGKASDAEKMELAELYQSLSEDAPPKGDVASWKLKTVALLNAANEAVKGDEKAAKLLPKLANCKECHATFKK